jgi:hypothetical protein
MSRRVIAAVAVAAAWAAAGPEAVTTHPAPRATEHAPARAPLAGASAARVSLTVTYDNGRGHRAVAHLRCGRRITADGFLADDRRRACRHARRHAAFLDRRPPANRQCIQIYGGPQVARVRGTIGSRTINRRFTRRDGCEIADWNRAVPLVPKVRG